MSGKLTRAAYEVLIKENLEWLERQPSTLENSHIKKIVMRSAEHEYGIPCDHDWVSGNNEKVTGAEICVKCLSVRASNL